MGWAMWTEVPKTSIWRPTKASNFVQMNRIESFSHSRKVELLLDAKQIERMA